MTIETAPVAPGAPAPDVELLASDGTAVNLAELWRARPLVLIFFGDLANPFTGDHAAQLRDAFSAFDDVGAGVAAVAHASPGQAAAFDERFALPYVVLADAGKLAFREFGVSAAGTFIIDSAGVVRSVRVAANAADYPPTSSLLAACSEITGIALPAPPEPAYDPSVYSTGPGSAPAGGVYRAFQCGKCGGTSSEHSEISTAGGWISRVFNFQHRKFVAVSCVACGYTEMYKRRAGGVENMLDLLSTG